MSAISTRAPAAHNRRLILVGTSGYAYRDWVRLGIYEPDADHPAMLARYAAEFPVTELRHTFYQVPSTAALAAECAAAPPGFCFVASAPRELLRAQSDESRQELAQQFRAALAPLLPSGQLAAVLLSFPLRFRRTPRARKRFAAIIEALAGLPLAVEFFSATWALDRVYAELEARSITLVNPDLPDLPSLFTSAAVATTPALAYLRLHGRNRAAWYDESSSAQFRYSYSQAELAEVVAHKVRPLCRIAERTLVLFNNPAEGQSLVDARALRAMLSTDEL